MPDTKHKILQSALYCFNEQGMPNVRLQHIADQAGISVGNLAYHYKTKAIILDQLYLALREKLQLQLEEFRLVPLFQDWDQLFGRYYELQQEYRFLYLDMLEVMRNYPEIAGPHREYITWQTQQLELSLKFNQSRGALIAPSYGFTALATDISSAMDLWMYRQAVLNLPTSSLPHFRDRCWQALIPWFSDIGEREFSQMKQLRQMGS